MIVDLLTKSFHFIPIKNTDSLERLARVYVSEIVKLHKVPRMIMSDRDPHFSSQFWQSLMSAKLKFSSAYYPQTDGQTERMIHTLEDMLKVYVLEHEGNWEKQLPLMKFPYNNSFQTAVQMVPYEALYERNANPLCIRTKPGKIRCLDWKSCKM